MQLQFFILLLFCSSVLMSRGHSVVHKAADAPAPAASNSSSSSSSPPPPPPNIVALMSKKGCKTFADLLRAGAGDAAKSFQDSAGGGLTVFCPNDGATKGFLPKFKNLTADGKLSLLLFHGVPVYYSLDQLKSSNGVMNTLATDGVANYNFTVQNNGEVVTLRTAGPTASIKTTVVDKDPLAVYSIDEVLEPLELFRPAEVPSPAPAPAPVADAPEAGKGKKKKHKEAPAPAGPEEQPADQKAADENAGGRACARWWTVAAAAVAAVAVVV